MAELLRTANGRTRDLSLLLHLRITPFGGGRGGVHAYLMAMTKLSNHDPSSSPMQLKNLFGCLGDIYVLKPS